MRLLKLTIDKKNDTDVFFTIEVEEGFFKKVNTYKCHYEHEWKSIFFRDSGKSVEDKSVDLQRAIKTELIFQLEK